jgi:urease accessory protein
MAEGRGTVRLVVEHREGCSVVARCGGSVPVAARVLRRARPGFAAVALVQTAGGPVGGDTVEIEVDVGPGAALEVSAVAATVALPGRGRVRQQVRCRVGSGGRLLWRAAPVIVAVSTGYEASLELDLAPGAAALVRETVVRGRHGEPGGSFGLRLWCDLAGAPLLRDAVQGAPGSATLDSASVLGGARAYGSVALLGERARAEDPDECSLAGPGSLVRALAGDALSLATRLAPVQSAYTRALAGHSDTPAEDCSDSSGDAGSREARELEVVA